MTWLMVLVGGMVGAALRYLADRAIQSRHGRNFPWGTLTVNVTGSLVLGVLAGATLGTGSPALQAFVGAGLCGALTTYSTFSIETLRMAESGSRFGASANVVGSVVLGVAAAFAGVAMADAIWN